MHLCKRIAITAGEPAGIGPDLVLMLAQTPCADERVVIADPDLLRERARLLDLPITVERFNPTDEPTPSLARVLKVLPVALKAPVKAGELTPENAQYVLDTLEVAGEGCLDGTFSAIVTAPVHKGVINDAGIAFSGHTEFFEALTYTPKVVMMLATEGLKVALATTHLPLRAVADAITAESLTQVIEVLDHDLQHHFGITKPRILVAGLNPHAGENGHMGQEEINTIIPVLDALRAKGLQLIGPLPADTLFTDKYLKACDAVLAMYHDQGLPVLKYKGFGNAVNITLGLPIIRTSVDHGTALDLAGTGQANASSLELAVHYAGSMARNKDKISHDA